MTSSGLRHSIFVCVVLAILAMPVVGHAQEATVSGTITDTTGGVLPGATITAVNEASGNSFEAVSDARGNYRLGVRIGSYRFTVVLAGFGAVARTLELQVGQTAVLNLQMAPSTVQENVTVTGQAPLIATTTSSVSGNIDPKQMSELPVLGRNWMSLSLLAPGNRTNTQGSVPVQDRHAGDVREFELNVDGQQVTAVLGTGNQARYSKDSIAEFQFISNRFDATQGRSSGVQVNAITKSGTNKPQGSFVGNFRKSTWGINQPDFVLKDAAGNPLKVPYSDQQWSGTFGGPIRKDKVHFFTNYDYEHQPITSIWNTPYPTFNITKSGVTSTKMAGLRLDYELSPKTRLMTKVSGSNLWQPFGGGASTSHPAATANNTEHSREVLVQLTQVLGSRALNEIKGGMSSYLLDQAAVAQWSHHWLAPDITAGGPRIALKGFSISQNANFPRHRIQKVWSVRDDFSFSYDAAGTHALKLGGEILYHNEFTRNCLVCAGEVAANVAPIPDSATLQAIFPDPFNVDTWNLNALSPIAISYRVGISNGTKFDTRYSIPKYGAWAQDDWTIGPRVTLNLGVRWDLAWNGFAQQVTFLPWIPANRPQDLNNVQPRFGFAYSLNDKTVLRGGGGLYYADVTSPNVQWPVEPATIAIISVLNNGRADFVSNPFNGPLPTFDQATQLYCYNKNVPGCLIRDLQELSPPGGKLAQVTHSWQSSVGMARQIGDTMALEADYVFTGTRAEHRIQDNVNIKFDQATGMPLDYAAKDANGQFINRPFPDWGVVSLYLMNGRSNYNGLQTVFTKRMSHRWQGTLTYTLSQLKDSDPQPLSGLTEVPFAVNKAFGNDYGPAVSDQRHRMVFNGIWDVAYGIQLSGIFFYGSGERTGLSAGAGLTTKLVGAGSFLGNDRLRTLDGTNLSPRNGFVGLPIKRVDMRLQRHFKLGGRMNADGLLELFNVFNRVNYGSYTTNESSALFKQPNSSTNLSYAPRTLQLGFRLGF